MTLETCPCLVLSVKDPCGVSGLNISEHAVISLIEQGDGIKTAETLNNLVCQHFKIEKENETEVFKAALFSDPAFLDRVVLTRNDGVVFSVTLKGKGRERMKNPPVGKQDVVLKPEKLRVYTKIVQNNEVVERYQDAHLNQLDNFGNEAIAFFNCTSFKKLVQFNHQHNYSRTMVKIDLTKMSRL